MFNIGDKIVYPMHGAGIIESIEEKEVLGNKNKYYIMRIPLDDMKVMIPLDNTEGLGVRNIISEADADKIEALLSSWEGTVEKNWSKRYRNSEETLRKGDVFEIAKLVRSLVLVDRAKKLSTGEKKILNNARQILTSELMLVWNTSRIDAEDMLNIMIK